MWGEDWRIESQSTASHWQLQSRSKLWIFQSALCRKRAVYQICEPFCHSSSVGCYGFSMQSIKIPYWSNWLHIQSVQVIWYHLIMVPLMYQPCSTPFIPQGRGRAGQGRGRASFGAWWGEDVWDMRLMCRRCWSEHTKHISMHSFSHFLLALVSMTVQKQLTFLRVHTAAAHVTWCSLHGWQDYRHPDNAAGGRMLSTECGEGSKLLRHVLYK